MPADPLKIISIIATPSVSLAPPSENNNNNNDNSNNSNHDNANNSDSTSDEGDSVSRTSAASTSTGSVRGYIPPRVIKSEEILFGQPTLSERLFRYMVIFIYLGGLSSLGFFLSIYYIFFWDSRMPPVFKPTKKPPTFIKP